MSDDQSDWSTFHKAALVRPARELLRRTLGCFQVERRQPGVAIDLGCGSGTDSLEMLRRGWEVHAVDSDPNGLEMLVQSVPPDLRHRLHTHAELFEHFDFPACDFIWAGWSLPYCPRESWPGFWQRALAALKPEGRIAGDLFGERHAWASEPEMLVLSEAQARSMLSTLVVEAFDIEDGIRPSGSELTRWHAFGFAARKATDAACHDDDAVIELITAANAALLDRVDGDVFDHPVQAGFVATFLANPANLLFVASVHEQVVGMASGVVYSHPDKPLQLFVNEVGVSSRFRRKGFGTRLMAALLQRGRDLGCAEAWVATEVGNAAARALYRSLGGREDDEHAVVYVYPRPPDPVGTIGP